MLLNVFLTLFLLIFSIDFNSSQSDKCTKCEVNPFRNEFKNCQCDYGKFCNTESKKCDECGDCFNSWDLTIRHTENAIKRLIKRLITSYDIEVETVQLTLTNLFENLEGSENFLELLQQLLARFDLLMPEFQLKIEEVKSDLNKLKDLLAKISDGSLNNNEFLAALKQLWNNYIETYIKIKAINFDANIKANIEQLNSSLKKIREILLNADNYVPKANLTVDALALANILEGELNHLEEKIKNLALTSDIGQYTKQMEMINLRLNKLLTLVKNVINDFLDVFNYVEETIQLHADATKLNEKAAEIYEKLSKLLEEERKFLEFLENMEKEKSLLEEIDFLQSHRLKKFQTELETLEKDFKLISDKKQEIERGETELNGFVERYDTEIKQLKAGILALEDKEVVLDKLLMEAEIMRETLESLEKLESVDDMLKDINKMTADVNKYTDKILEYCRNETIDKERTL